MWLAIKYVQPKDVHVREMVLCNSSTLPWVIEFPVSEGRLRDTCRVTCNNALIVRNSGGNRYFGERRILPTQVDCDE